MVDTDWSAWKKCLNFRRIATHFLVDEWEICENSAD